MKSNKHILLFTPGFPTDEGDGNCLPTVQNYVRELAESGKVNMTVLSLHYPFESRSYVWNRINVIALGGANRRYPSRFLLWNKAMKALNKIHEEKPIDVIHSFWMHECGMLGSRFARKYKIKQVITLMGQDMKPPNRFVRFVNQDSATLVSLSNFQPQLMETGIRQPDEIIPFGLPEREKQWVKSVPKTIDVLGVGSLIHLKNYEQFIRVIALLKKDNPEMRAEVIGDGVERKKLTELIDKLGLKENVKFIGHLPRNMVYEKMNQARVFLHTSDYETQGYVFNEALLTGLPIVSKRVGVASEQPYWKLGNTDEELAEHVQYFLSNTIEIPTKAQIGMNQTVKQYLKLYKC